MVGLGQLVKSLLYSKLYNGVNCLVKTIKTSYNFNYNFMLL